jgi:HK97 family phage major capsid protein
MNKFQRLAHGITLLFASTVSIQDLQDKLSTLTASAKAVQDKADAEKRDLTDDEAHEVESFFAAFDATDLEIKRRERVMAMEAKLDKSAGRMTEPTPMPGRGPAAMEVPAAARITGGGEASERSGTNGFRNVGEFALSVKNSLGGRGTDPRLRPLAASPATQSQEAAGSDGGYLVPPDFRTAIMQKVQGEEGLLGKTDNQITSSNSITVPVDESTPWQTSGGVQVYWEGEGTPLNQSKVALNSVTVRANKIAALVPVTDELLEDAPSLTAYLGRKVPDKVNYKINDALINGDGVMKPLGILASPALVTQAAEAAQVAATVVYANITKMWSRMYAPLRRNAVWLVNQDIEPQLGNLTAPGNTFPAYVGPGGLQNNFLNGSLMGRPIIYSEACSAIGTPGDIMLVDFSQYLSITKGGMKQDVSMHLWFDYGLTAFRFTLRTGGTPWWASSITRAKSALPLSFAVALATR